VKGFFRKTLKIFGFLFAAAILILAASYTYLASQEGIKAPERFFFGLQNTPTLVFAHRGGGGNAPENTLEAFRNSIANGADILEIDVRATADGELVVFHDSTTNRTTNLPAKISELTLAELKTTRRRT
jgi:glycerophosphoryl diester phosphodiesterase